MDYCITISDDEVELIEHIVNVEPVLIDLTEPDPPSEPQSSEAEPELELEHQTQTQSYTQPQSQFLFQSQNQAPHQRPPTPKSPAHKPASQSDPKPTTDYQRRQQQQHQTQEQPQQRTPEPPKEQPPTSLPQKQQHWSQQQHYKQQSQPQNNNQHEQRQEYRAQGHQHQHRQHRPATPQQQPRPSQQHQQQQQQKQTQQQANQQNQRPTHEPSRQPETVCTRLNGIEPIAENQLPQHEQLIAKKNLGNDRYKQNLFSEALRTYREACELAKRLNDSEMTATLHFNLAMTYDRLGSFNQAVDQCAMAVKIKPNYMKPHLKRAEIYEKLRKLDEAVICWEHICELDSTNREYAIRLNRLREAAKHIKKREPFELLGLNPINFSREELKKAYKRKALTHHPDRHPDADVVTRRIQEKMFKDASEAHSHIAVRYGYNR